MILVFASFFIRASALSDLGKAKQKYRFPCHQAGMSGLASKYSAQMFAVSKGD